MLFKKDRKMKCVEVAAAIIIKDSRVLATQRGYGNYKDWWEFPGGKTEPGETPEQALRREIREELNADIIPRELFCTVEYDYPEFHLVMHCYICELASDTFTLIEHEAAKWLPADELKSVKWLPSDLGVIEMLEKKLRFV